MESDDSPGGDGHPDVALAVQTPPPVVAANSSQSSSEFAVVPDIDLLGLSQDARVVPPSDSSSTGHTDGLSISDSTS